MKKIKKLFLACFFAATVACSGLITAHAADIPGPLPIGPTAPVLEIDGSGIMWSAYGSPYQFTILVDGYEVITLGPYANVYNLNDLNLEAGRTYIIAVTAYFDIGDGGAMLALTSNGVPFTPAPALQQLPTPTIRIIGGYYLEISASWGTVPDLVRNSAYFVIYSDGYERTRIRATVTSLDLTTLNLSPSQHSIYVSIVGDGVYWQDSFPSNTVYYTVPQPAQQIPTPSLTAYGTNVTISLYQGNMPGYVYQNIEYIVYVNGDARQRTVRGNFSLEYFNLRPGTYQVLVVATSSEYGWNNSRRSNTVNVTIPGGAGFANAAITPTSVPVGGYVEVNVTGITYANRLVILTQAGGAVTAVHTVTNPGSTVNYRLNLNNANINAVVVRVYGYGDTAVSQESVLPVTVGIAPALAIVPFVLDNGIGVLLEWNAVPNNVYGYRVFRASSEAGAGVPIDTAPVALNAAYSHYQVVTVDANASPGSSNWYYVREIRQSYPEVLGPPSYRVRVDIPASAPPLPYNVTRGFVMMLINNPRMNVNNAWLDIDALGTVPIISNLRTMVPIRAIIAAMGGRLEWNDPDRRMDIWFGGNHVQMWLDRSYATVNGQTRQMDIAPYVRNSTSLIPVRYVAEFLGAQIDWTEEKQMVVIVYDRQQ